MIQQKKSVVPPASLARGVKYNEDDVCQQLYEDHHGKCYLCEQPVGNLYEVEHLRSRKFHPERTHDWNNLFLACTACNRKKGSRFDNLPDPLSTPLEEYIRIIPNLEDMGSSVQVSLISDIPGGEQAVQLLSRIHNGSDPRIGRSHREEVFYNRYIKEITRFNVALMEYRRCASALSRQNVVDMLSLQNSFLGTKYSILRECGLLTDFAEEIRWNKAPQNAPE